MTRDSSPKQTNKQQKAPEAVKAKMVAKCFTEPTFGKLIDFLEENPMSTRSDTTTKVLENKGRLCHMKSFNIQDDTDSQYFIVSFKDPSDQLLKWVLVSNSDDTLKIIAVYLVDLCRRGLKLPRGKKSRISLVSRLVQGVFRLPNATKELEKLPWDDKDGFFLKALNAANRRDDEEVKKNLASKLFLVVVVVVCGCLDGLSIRFWSLTQYSCFKLLLTRRNGHSKS